MGNSIQIDRNVPMEMRDGVLLRADILRPQDNDKHPAVLIRTPYNKSTSGMTDFFVPVDAAFAGFAVVLQDVRGRFASDGEYWKDDIVTVEGPDGYDSIEWIAGQKWCDGNVGMGGLSYMGVLQWIAAMQKPPHLKAIAPWMAGTAPWVEVMHLGGVIPLHLWSFWTPWMALDVADKAEKQGKDVSKMRASLYHALFNLDDVNNFLPLSEVPQFQWDGVREIWDRQLTNAMPGPEMENLSYWQYENVMVPCMQVSGWLDLYTWSICQNFSKMKERGGTPAARQGQHMIIGPWAHDGHLPAFAADVSYGLSGSGLGAMLTAQHIAYYNKYLRGMDIDLPAVRYFVMGQNVWKTAPDWPPPNTEWQRHYLHSGGKANSASGNGALSRKAPGREAPDSFSYDPLNPVPMCGGRLASISGAVAGQREQSFIEKRDDVLCYTTAELVRDTEVSGPLDFHLFASTSAVDTDFTVKLVDVYPDGQAFNVADGILRARYRHSVFHPELVTPGEVYEFLITMGNTSQMFRKGHKIRIQVSSSNFPAYDRNMNTGNLPGTDKEGIIARQKVFHDDAHASYIDLPLAGQ